MRLIIFIAVAVSVYTAVHALVYWGIRPLLIGHPFVPTLVRVWMALMILAPVAVRVVERTGHELVARALAWVGYSWMGLVFLAFSVFVAIGVWELLAWLLATGLPLLPRFSIHGPQSAAVVLLITLAAGLYGFYEASQLRVETVNLTTSKLGAGTARMRVVQISDLHLGLLHRERVLAPIVSRLKELKPDLLVATGDVVDAQINHLDGLSNLWNEIDPPLGKFAVIGNHEVYAGLGQALDFLHRSGFSVLRNEGRALGAGLTLVGVDDGHAGASPAKEVALLQAQPAGSFTILLKHRPAVAPGAAGRFDLQLSGHAHRGQIFPFQLLTGLANPMQDGLYSLPGGGHLYASRGTGTWGPPMRVLSPPEITVFEITAARKVR
jgi:predicted MPP superfamily phosphohydrolase